MKNETSVFVACICNHNDTLHTHHSHPTTRTESMVEALNAELYVLGASIREPGSDEQQREGG